MSEQMTRDSAIAQLICIVPVVRDIEQVFDFVCDWQKSQPCPSCASKEALLQEMKKKLEEQGAEVKRLEDTLHDIAYNTYETESEVWAIAQKALSHKAVGSHE